MKKIKFFALTLLATLAFSLTSCDKDKDLDYQNNTLKEGQYVTVSDYAGVDSVIYKLNFKFGIKGGNLVVEGQTSKIEVPYMQTMQGLEDPMAGVAIMDYGKVKGLTLVESLPADSDFGTADKPTTSVTPEKKHGYVVKAWGKTEYPSYLEWFKQNGWNTPVPVYVRIWIADEDDGEYEIRYEYPWKP